MAVGYTTVNEVLFKPIKDVIYVHDLELINVCFNRINFIE